VIGAPADGARRRGAYLARVGVLERVKRWLPFGAVPEIDHRELADRLEGRDAPVVLDVRTETEHARSRIPGARNVPIHRLPKELDALDLAPGAEVVAICRTAHRSIPAVRLLRERGFDAAQLKDGMQAWWAAGLPTERG
jgi:rhodanese-related sulfurtransferase